jgi:serine/threonine protein kinase
MAERHGSNADVSNGATLVTGGASSDDRDDLTHLSSVGIERFRIGELLGEGGMGEVRSAFDVHIGREVAVKRLLRSGPGRADAEMRFLREARV